MTSMEQELESVTRHLVKNLGEASNTLFRGQIDRAQAAGIDDTALTCGSIAPDFLLPDAQGNHVGLNTLLASGPVVLTFYRGGWCPYCNIQLRAFQKVLNEIREYGTQLVAISPSTPEPMP